MPFWIDALEAAEQCGDCGRPVGPGVVALSDEHGAAQRAVCVVCFEAIVASASRRFSHLAILATLLPPLGDTT